MKKIYDYFRRNLAFAMAIFAGAMLATTSCTPNAPFGNDSDGDGIIDYGFTTSVDESQNQIVFTILYNSGMTGNSIYNTSFKTVFTFTFSDDLCTKAIAVTTYESQLYADASYTGDGVKQGKTITYDMSDDYRGQSKQQIREVIALMEDVYKDE